MLEVQLSTSWARVSASRRCPQCEAPAAIQHATPGRPGFEHLTLRCPKCGNISEAQVQTDPMKSEAVGWLAGDLHAPT
jgi:rubredoxin